jgi:hypothetical protein
VLGTSFLPPQHSTLTHTCYFLYTHPFDLFDSLTVLDCIILLFCHTLCTFLVFIVVWICCIWRNKNKLSARAQLKWWAFGLSRRARWCIADSLSEYDWRVVASNWAPSALMTHHQTLGVHAADDAINLLHRPKTTRQLEISINFDAPVHIPHQNIMHFAAQICLHIIHNYKHENYTIGTW